MMRFENLTLYRAIFLGSSGILMVRFRTNDYWVSQGFRLRWQVNPADNSRCGDGLLDYLSEDCDDGNSDGGDGCSNCTVEAGWRCPDGAACERACAYTLSEGSGENQGFWDPSNDYADGMLCTWLIAPSAGSNSNISVRFCPAFSSPHWVHIRPLFASNTAVMRILGISDHTAPTSLLSPLVPHSAQATRPSHPEWRDYAQDRPIPASAGRKCRQRSLSEEKIPIF
jgi:cysteine-rich repeat protein